MAGKEEEKYLKVIILKYGLRYYRDYSVIDAQFSNIPIFPIPTIKELNEITEKVKYHMVAEKIKIKRVILKPKRIPLTVKSGIRRIIGQYRLLKYEQGKDIYISYDETKINTIMIIYEIEKETITGRKVVNTVPVFIATVPCKFEYD